MNVNTYIHTYKGRGTRRRPNLPAELRFFGVKISANHVGKCRSTFDDLDL